MPQFHLDTKTPSNRAEESRSERGRKRRQRGRKEENMETIKSKTAKDGVGDTKWQDDTSRWIKT